MKLSAVTTMYYSAPYIEEFYERVSRAVQEITDDYEIIFVNDGSPDDSLNKAVNIYEKDERVRIIDFSRNFGHHKAIMTGLSYTQGDLVFLIDCDLEEDPAFLGTFYLCLKETAADVVYGVQKKRKGNWFERLSGFLFYLFFNWLSNFPIPPNQVTVRLMSRRYVQNLINHQDQEIFLAGLWAITGFKQVPIEIVKLSKGATTYTLMRKISILVNSIISFSNKPLAIIFYMGIFISIPSFLAICYLVLQKIFFGNYLAGWPSLVASVWFLGGITILSLGIIGGYLSKIFTEVKQRPYTIIRHIYQSKDGKI